MDAPGADVVSFAVHGTVHAFYMQNRAVMHDVLEQLFADDAIMHEARSGLAVRILRRMGRIARDLDSTPEFLALGDVDARRAFIKHRYGTSTTFAITIEEIWYYSGNYIDEDADLAARARSLQ